MPFKAIAWQVSKYRDFRVQSENRKTQTRKNSVFENFSRSVHFEKLGFLQRQDVPKIWDFGPTLTPICPLKMVKIKTSYRVIQISQNQGLISFQFLMKSIITFCAIWSFFGTSELKVKDQQVTA